MNKKTNGFKNILTVLLTLLLLGIAVGPADAAADITIADARITTSNKVVVTFDENDGELDSINYTKWHIDVGDNGATPLNSTGVVLTKATSPGNITLVFAGTPFSDTNKSYNASWGLYVESSGVKDDNGDTNTIIGHAASIAIADGQTPTFIAARTALNTIVLTFSEPVDAADMATAAWTVAGATVISVTDPASSTTLTLTTTGLTNTSSTPSVSYVAASGTVKDVSPAKNEVKDGSTANASDKVPPTFTAARTALNTIVLTFSEPVDAADTATAAWTVGGATVNSVTDPASSITLTITTTGLTSTNSTPAVSYVAASGTVKDVSAAQNEVADGATAIASDYVKPTVTSATLNYDTGVLNITFSETIYADLTNASKFHLDNISGTNDVNLTDATTTVTNGTILSFTLTEEQRAAAFNISGMNGGDGGAIVLDIDAGGVTDLVNNTNDADLDNTVTETFTAANTTAVITLNSTAYVSGTATVSVNDFDMNTIINSNQTLTVNLTSSTTSTNLTLTLTETDVNSGIFNGTFTFGSASSGTTLGVSDGDTIYAKYPDNDSVLRSTDATFNAVATKLTINSTTYGNLTDRNGAAVTPASMVAGVATVFNINATDANGVLDTGFNGTMTISVNGSGTLNLASYTFVAADNGSKSISVTDNVAETIAINFNSSSVTTNATATQAVVPNRPYKLLFNSSMPLSTLTNSLQVKISVADAYNNLVDASKLTGDSFPTNATQLGGTDGLGLGIKFNLSLSLPTPPPVSAYLDTTSVVITNANVNNYVAYVNNTVDEVVTLKATAVFFSPACIITNLSFMGAVSDMLVTTNKTGNTSHANNGANSLGIINISAQLRDASGNALTVPNEVITFNSDNTTVLNVAGQTATTNASGIAIITISTTNVAGNAVITATDSTGREGLVTVSTTAIVNNVNSELVVNPTARAGDNITVYATLHDYAGTVMPAGTTVSFNITSGDLTSTLNSVAKGTIVTADTNSTGIATVTFRASNASGVHSINATVIDELGDIKQVGTSEQTITVSPGDAAVLVVSPASKGLTNIKGANVTYNVTVYDAYDNVNTSAIKVNVSTTDTTLGNMTVNSTVVNNYAVITTSSGIGSMLYMINSTTAGSATLTFAVYKNETGQLPGLFTNFTDSVLVSTSGATRVTITPGSTGAAVNTNISLTVNLTDNDGNLIGIDGTNINLVSTGGSLSASSVNSSGGQGSTNLTSSTAGDVTVTVYVAGLSPAATTLTFSGNATKFVVTPDISSVVVNGTINITIQAYDSLNNKAAIYNDAVISTRTGVISSISGLTFSATSFTFNATGYAGVKVTSATAGTYTIQAVALGLVNTTDVTFTTAPIPALTVSATPATVTAGTPTTVTFNVASNGFAINNAIVTLSGVATGSGITDSSGLTVISVNAISSGTITATASLSGYTDGTTGITAKSAEISIPALTVSATPATVRAGTPTSVTFDVTSSGIAVPNAAVTLSGVATGSGITNASGFAVIGMNATSAGKITATANLGGYTDGTTTITVNTAEILAPALTVSATHANVKAGTAASVTFNVTSSGIAIANAKITLGGVATGSVNTNTSGLAVLRMNATSKGTITATVNKSGYNDGIINITAEEAEIVVGTETVGIYRHGAFYLRNSNDAGNADSAFIYGIDGDIPLVGDWNGDGADTVGICRHGSFYLRNSNDAGNANSAFIYGIDGDIPLVGDWNGDGTDTVGIYRHGSFYLKNNNSAGSADLSFVYGIDGDTPLVGDWDGDGTDTVGIYRHGSFYLRNSNDAGNASSAFIYGIDRDTPIVGDWNGDGTDTVGIYRHGAFYLRNSNSAGNADLSFIYGIDGDIPLAGDWDGQ
ncbi:MAG: hypothetical protein OIN85_09875 [Candidatus Methanoperedens sp.]|nr:hypothetical protein [Candidatus Methanoperedens sp.]